MKDNGPSRMRETAARAAVGLGCLGAVFSWGVDVLTCPGEVKQAGSGTEVATVPYCDEDPQHNNLLNSPGTPEQKFTYGSIALAMLGGISLRMPSGRCKDQL